MYNLRGLAIHELKMFNCRVFRRYDEDANNKLNLEEFTNAVKECGLDISDEEINQVFTKIDTDEDGSVDIDEFLIAVRVCVFLPTQTLHFAFSPFSVWITFDSL